MPSFIPRVNNFLYIPRIFFAATVSRFPKARGAFMLPLAFEVNNFFPSCETFCSAPGAKSFSPIARSGYAPLRANSQLFFLFPRKFFSLAFP